MLGQAAAEGRGVRLADVEARARDGQTGPAPDGAIGFSVMRGGGIVGEHSVLFAAEDEIVTLSHSARDRAPVRPRRGRGRGLGGRQARRASTAWTTCWGCDRSEPLGEIGEGPARVAVA